MKINRHGRAKVPTRSKHGAPIHLMQATLGHNDITTTSRYQNASPDDTSAMSILVGFGVVGLGEGSE